MERHLHTRDSCQQQKMRTSIICQKETDRCQSTSITPWMQTVRSLTKSITASWALYAKTKILGAFAQTPTMNCGSFYLLVKVRSTAAHEASEPVGPTSGF